MNCEKPGANPPEKPGAKPLALEEVPFLPTKQAKVAGSRVSGPTNRQTRLHKGAKPPYVPPRPDICDITRRLTDRDRAILRALGRHRVFASPQLTAMFFDSQKRSLWRLLELYRMGALDRFQPYRPGWGAYPYHYVLGRLGASVVAAGTKADANAASRRWRPDRGLALGCPERLTWLVGLNGLCAALVAHARRHPGTRLADWMTEAEVRRWVDRIVSPHAYFEWCQDGTSMEFFVEWDRQETAESLRIRLEHYAKLETDRAVSTWVLFAFPSPRREAAVRAALTDATVPVATATVSGDIGPNSAVWWPLAGAGRLRLVDLARVPIPPESSARVAKGSLRAWWYEGHKSRWPERLYDW